MGSVIQSAIPELVQGVCFILPVATLASRALAHALPLGKGSLVPTGQEPGWAPEPAWTQMLEEKSFHLCQGSNLNYTVVQYTARHYTDRATLAHS
jgi:hypothetical protein